MASYRNIFVDQLFGRAENRNIFIDIVWGKISMWWLTDSF